MRWEVIPCDRKGKPVVYFGIQYRTLFFAQRRVDKENRIVSGLSRFQSQLDHYRVVPSKRVR